MSSLLRRPHTVARSSRQLLEAASLSTTLARRPASLPRPLYAYARSRQYASKPDKSRDDETKAAKSAGSPAKGMEHLYSENSPMSSQRRGSESGNEKDGLLPGRSKFTAEEEKVFTDVLNLVKKGMPKTMAKDVESSIEQLKKDGMPDELRTLMREIAKEGLSPSRAARIWRITSSLARHAADQSFNNTANEAKQKTADEPGPADNKSKQKGKKEDQPFELRLDMANIIVSAFVSYLLYRLVVPSENSREISWQEFRTTFLDKGLVEKLQVLDNQKVRVYLHRESVASAYPESPAAQAGFYYYFSIGSVEGFERQLDEAQKELGIPSSQKLPVSYSRGDSSWFSLLIAFGPTLLFVAGIVYLSRRAGSGAGGGNSGIFGMGRSRAKKFNHETDVKVKFSDVAGMDEAKLEIMEFVSFLKDPSIYQKLGAKIPRGAVLSGPPGTGKTLLAKATAGESGVPFFSVSGSEFVEMFVGVGASRVRDLFANARKNTPCIIFIDEIDAIGKSRQKSTFGGNEEREATLNQILTEMDGFNTADQVVVLAGTNRADVLDKALMRPGRFDRHIAIEAPTLEGRKQIFAVHLKKIVTKEDLDYIEGRLAALTPGFSGADIANCVNEAALIAARSMAESVTMKHFEQAIERVVGGLEKKSMVITPSEKKTIAYHEAGHAICGWYFQYADPLLKVSIIPRGKALGYAQYLPGGGRDEVLMNVKQLMDRMAMTLGGRVSEELHFDTVTSGASDDFNKVTRMATAMVTKWGMSKIGYIYYSLSGESQETQFQKPFSESTAQAIDAEVKRIVDEAYAQCKTLLEEKKKEVGLVAEELLAKEMLTRDDMIRILGPRPWGDGGEFSKYFGGGPLAPQPGANEPPVPGAGGEAPPSPPPSPLGGPEPASPSLFEDPKETKRV